jgi:hypothetical protein
VPTAQGADENGSPLLDLPAPVISHIARCEFKVNNSSRGNSQSQKSQPGHPLLGVSQACRDAVLHATRTIKLLPIRPQADASAAQKSADARLLHHACCEASPRLEVSLYMGCFTADTLPVLLQPGISSGGWTKVHTLKVRLWLPWLATVRMACSFV